MMGTAGVMVAMVVGEATTISEYFMIYNKPYWGESHTVIRNSDVFDNATLSVTLYLLLISSCHLVLDPST
jgi:hypothetical protein